MNLILIYFWFKPRDLIPDDPFYRLTCFFSVFYKCHIINSPKFASIVDLRTSLIHRDLELYFELRMRDRGKIFTMA